MAGEDRSFGELVASAARYIIVGLIAVVLFGTSDDGRSAMNRAYASGGIAAAPGYLATTINGNGRFYVTDTNAKIICVYALHGGCLKLVSARKFDNDEKIFDGSLPAPKGIEGGSGVTYEQTEMYLKNAKPQVESLMKKLGRSPTE